jgi:rhodanese-related sulfurtransferase
VTLGFEIHSGQAKMLFDMGVPFIDAREAQFFEEGHVERAMNMTADEVIAHAAELVRWRPGPIVVYCSGGDCDASHHVAQRLQTLQFTQIHIMTDGFPGWQDKHYPVATGK